MRRAAKRDANEDAIIDALVAAGCAVYQISDDGGFPDLVVWTGTRYVLLEVKLGNESFTPKQKSWHASWRGPAHVVRSPEDALLVVRNANVTV